MLQAFMIKKLVGLILRHALTAGGAVVVSNGYVDEATWQTISAGALALTTGLGMSVLEKKYSVKF